jgi:hypothetical protein
VSWSDLVKLSGAVALTVAGFTVSVTFGLVVLGVLLVVAGWLLED